MSQYPISLRKDTNIECKEGTSVSDQVGHEVHNNTEDQDLRGSKNLVDEDLSNP